MACLWYVGVAGAVFGLKGGRPAKSDGLGSVLDDGWLPGVGDLLDNIITLHWALVEFHVEW